MRSSTLVALLFEIQIQCHIITGLINIGITLRETRKDIMEVTFMIEQER